MRSALLATSMLTPRLGTVSAKFMLYQANEFVGPVQEGG